jgi:hypothetical protein
MSVPQIRKQVFVLLAFHAHEPIWDLPTRLQRNSRDPRLNQSVTGDNYIRKRAREGRNFYRDMLALSQKLKAPVTLDITNELLHQLRSLQPNTFQMLRSAYQEGTIYPLYTTAHHTHVALLNDEELIEELRLNETFLHQVLGAHRPMHKTFFFTECSVDSRFLDCLEREGVRAIIFSHLDEQKMNYQVSNEKHNYVYQPFLVGNKTIALPRHFQVSQEIWRPITRWHVAGVRNQGFLMGQYPVFDNEYSNNEKLSFPIDKQQAVEEYAEVLRRAIAEAPHNGLILYIQDLELMDFGDAALEILSEAWPKVLQETEVDIRFVTPDEFIESSLGCQLPAARVDFERGSWAPEIRVLLRSDGHYPPLGAGSYKGIDAVQSTFKRYPFIYWEPGRFLTEPFGWVLEAFGYSLLANISSKVLSDIDYDLERLPYEKQLPMHLRLMKRACNWGWQVDEGRAKWPYLHGIYIADQLLLQLELYPLLRPKAKQQLDERTLRGLERALEGFIDTRIGYLTLGLERLRDERNFNPGEGLRQLACARDYREQAAEAGRALSDIYSKFANTQTKPNDRSLWEQFLTNLKRYCLSVFLSYDHMQRAWSTSPDVGFLVETMYRYLYDIYPPLFPRIFDELSVVETENLESQAS